jgi:hydroxypyruvate isomerase
MPRFAANLTMLFTEYPLPERFDRAAAAGFQAVEFLFPYDEDVLSIAAALRRNGLRQVLFNLPAGDFVAGERGFANDPARVGAFRDGVERALEIADQLDCRQINCLAGLELPDVPIETQWGTMVDNLRFAAERTSQAGVRLLVEPLNDIDSPGFLLTTTSQGLMLLDEVGHPNLALQYDVYHAQRMEGNLTATLRRHLDRIGHIQIADSPDRHQPGTGEINYPFVLATLDEIGYGGWVSLEYRPAPDTEQSLGWLRDWGYWDGNGAGSG